MHALFDKVPEGDGFRYTFKEEKSLAGRNKGMIPHLLEIHLNGQGSAPLPWHFSVEEEIKRSRWPNCALLINLKPSATTGRLSLYEVNEVWGFSNGGWTPIMLHLKEISDLEAGGDFRRLSFLRRARHDDDPVFTFLYVNGTVEDGEVTGRWSFPGRSSTNSVLLWPYAFQYFCEEANKVLQRARA